MGIHNTHMYEKAIVAMAKQSVTLEVLSYHASATTDDAVRLMVKFQRHTFFHMLNFSNKFINASTAAKNSLVSIFPAT